MTDLEMKALFERSYSRSEELERITRAGFTLTSKEAIEFSECVRNLGIVARASWLKAGKPRAPEFEVFYQDQEVYH